SILTCLIMKSFHNIKFEPTRYPIALLSECFRIRIAFVNALLSLEYWFYGEIYFACHNYHSHDCTATSESNYCFARHEMPCGLNHHFRYRCFAIPVVQQPKFAFWRSRSLLVHEKTCWHSKI